MELTKYQTKMLAVIEKATGGGWFTPDSLPYPTVKRPGFVCSTLNRKGYLKRRLGLGGWNYCIKTNGG